jgi:hypothetical protein
MRLEAAMLCKDIREVQRLIDCRQRLIWTAMSGRHSIHLVYNAERCWTGKPSNFI